jgi:hypothetical protein
MRSSRLAFLLLLSIVQAVRLDAEAQTPCQAEHTYQNGAFGTKDCEGRFTPDHKPAFTAAVSSSRTPEERTLPVPASEPQTQAADSDPRATEYAAWHDKYVERVYEWQYYSSMILFLVVLALVVSGLYFAYMQFKVSLQVAGTKPADQELTIDAHGVVLKSSFLGVVILAFSLAFFFLYLRYVYPITATDFRQSVAATRTSKP